MDATKVEIPQIEIQDLLENPVAVLSSNKGEYPPSNITVTQNINEVGSISFNIPALNPKIQYLINENLIVFEGETYIINHVGLSDEDKSVYQINAESEFIALKNKQCKKFEYIAETVSTLISAVLSSTGFVFGGTDIPDTTKRQLFTEGGESAFENLCTVAQNFNARLEFSTAYVNGNKIKSVQLFSKPTDRYRYIKKSKDLKSVNIDYDTSEMVTKLEVFGAVNEVTGEPYNMMSVNPTGKSYVENYSYYINKGVPVDKIQGNYRFVKELTLDNTDLMSPKAVYNYAVDKLKELCVPRVDCTATMADLHVMDEYMLSKPELGEKITIIDETINLVVEAELNSISKNYDNPLDIQIGLSNVIERNSAIKQLVNSSQTVDKITDTGGKIQGTYIKEATIGSAQIGQASIDKAHIKDLAVDTGKIENLAVTNAKIENATITGAKIAEATIGNGHIIDLNAGKIKAGSIKTNLVTIESESGGIVIADNTQQFKDENGIVRIQMGRDAQDKFSFGIFDETGQGTLIDSTGVKEGALGDGIIKERMIPDNEIGGVKINIDSLVTEINSDTNTSSIKGSKIIVDTEGQTIDVAFKEVNQKIDSISTAGAVNHLPDANGEEGKWTNDTIKSTITIVPKDDPVFIDRGLLIETKSGVLETDEILLKSPPFRMRKNIDYTLSFLVGNVNSEITNIIGKLNANGVFTDITFNPLPTYPVYENTRSETESILTNVYKVQTRLKITEDCLDCQIQLGFNPTNISILEKMWFKKFKVEEGTVASDWSPYLDTLNTTLTEMNTNFNVQQGQIDTLVDETTIITQDGQVVSLKQDYNETKQTVKSLSQSVGQIQGDYVKNTTYTQDKDSFNFKISESGATNLIKNSIWKFGFKRWKAYSSQGSSGWYNINTQPNWAKPGFQSGLRIVGVSGENRSVYQDIEDVKFYKDNVLSISYWGKTNNYSGQGGIIAELKVDYDDGSTKYYNFTGNIGDPWTYYTGTFTMEKKVSTLRIIFRVNSIDSNYYITEPMLTIGSVPQQWSPHPSEINAGLVTIDGDGITITNGGLTIKNNSGDDVLVSDGSGNLSVVGTMTSTSGSGKVEMRNGMLNTYDSAGRLSASIGNFAVSVYDPYTTARSLMGAMYTTEKDKDEWMTYKGNNIYNLKGRKGFSFIGDDTTKYVEFGFTHGVSGKSDPIQPFMRVRTSLDAGSEGLVNCYNPWEFRHGISTVSLEVTETNYFVTASTITKYTNGYQGVDGELRVTAKNCGVGTIVYRPCRASAFTQSSLRALKTNIEKATFDAREMVNGMTIYSFDYKGDLVTNKGRELIQETGSHHYGVIIDDLSSETLRVVGNPEGDGIDLYNMTSVSLKCLQEHDKEITDLKNEVESLKNTIKDILSKLS